MVNLKPTSGVYVGKWKGSKCQSHNNRLVLIFSQTVKLRKVGPMSLKSTLNIKCGYVRLIKIIETVKLKKVDPMSLKDNQLLISSVDMYD